jgi:peptidoglycan/xylan/chitin deacetylase (PgdA/CDA1 family)
MEANPLGAALSFWKPLAGQSEFPTMATYAHAIGRPSPGIRVLRSSANPRGHIVRAGNAEFRLFGAVYPIAAQPESAEVVAEILDASGEPCSMVLWFPEERCAVIPFDPSAAVESFRYERYVPDARRTVLPASVLSAYYGVKRFLPSAVRQGMRRALARRTGEEPHFLDWPSDQSQDEIQRLILRLMMMVLGRDRLPFVWFWPNAHSWAAILTHDVESADGLARIPHVMELERSKGLRSSFNLVPYGYEVPGSLLELVGQSGFEIGVHGYRHDGLMFSSWSTFLDRIVAVNECARQWGASGFRSPATYRNLEWFHLLGFEYDSSVTDTAPFEPQPGGCASLFPYAVGDILELPMTLPQDHTLFALLGHSDARMWLEKLARIQDANGMACVLTHPDASSGYVGEPRNEEHYREVLGFIAESDAWTPLPRDLARWWRERSVMHADEGRVSEAASVGTALLDSSGALRIVPPTPSNVDADTGLPEGIATPLLGTEGVTGSVSARR